MLPTFLKPYLWSFDIDNLDLTQHKKIIIFQLLNFGSKEATDWLFTTYPKQEIIQVANTIPQTQWDKKSLNLWVIVLGLTPPKKRLLHSKENQAYVL